MNILEVVSDTDTCDYIQLCQFSNYNSDVCVSVVVSGISCMRYDTFLAYDEAEICLRALRPFSRGSGSNPEEVVLGLSLLAFGDESVPEDEEGMAPSEKATVAVVVAAVKAENKPEKVDFAIEEEVLVKKSFFLRVLVGFRKRNGFFIRSFDLTRISLFQQVT